MNLQHMYRGSDRGSNVDGLAKKSHKPTKYATITDLPNEVLLMILSELTEHDLYSLALLCRRLNVMALPIYFSFFNFRFKPVIKQLSLKTYMACPLPGLRIALFIGKLDRLEVDYSDIFHGVCFNRSFGRMLGVKRLVSRMSSISSVKLFGDSCGITMLVTWDILNILPGKECQHLDISGNANSFCVTLRGHPLHLQSLRSAAFLADFLFSPPFKTWVIRSINASPIRHLALSADNVNLGDILPQLTLPSLDTFSLSCQSLSSSDLTAFLTRHP